MAGRCLLHECIAPHTAVVAAALYLLATCPTQVQTCQGSYAHTQPHSRALPRQQHDLDQAWAAKRSLLQQPARTAIQARPGASNEQRARAWPDRPTTTTTPHCTTMHHMPASSPPKGAHAKLLIDSTHRTARCGRRLLQQGCSHVTTKGEWCCAALHPHQRGARATPLVLS